MIVKDRIEVVAGVIFDRAGLLLAAQRPADKSHAGFWEFPGGKVEPGETCARALERELAEELAMRVTVLDEMYRLTVQIAPEKSLILHFIRALAMESSPPVACEGQAFKWVKKSEIRQLEWLPTDREFVEYLAATYGN